MEIAYNYLNLPAEVRFVEEKINYIYNAAGEKVSKIVIDEKEATTTTTLYQDGFQYVNDTLRFFPTSEGYVSVNDDRFNYVYNYTDNLGNIRLSFLKDPENPAIGILEENNYYPFGLKHENYNAQKLKLERSDDGVSIVLRPTVRNIYQYKYQGQERQDELGLNWDSFKWRNYDYTIGRFMSMDKLAEDYVYNSPYAFAENRVVDGREMEGLEWTSSTSSDGKTVSLNLNVNPVNNTGGILTNEQVAGLANDRAHMLSCSLGGTDSAGRTVNVTVTQSKDATISWEYNNALSGDGIDFGKSTPQEIETTLDLASGITSKIGDTQSNKTQVNIGKPQVMQYDDKGMPMIDDKASRATTSQTGVHEDLHVLGGRHENDKKNTPAMAAAQKTDPKNAVNDGATGTHVLPAQRTQFIKTIEEQQPQ